MTRDEVKKIFADATNEQINELLNIHSGDIGKIKSESDKAKADYETAKKTIENLQNDIKELNDNKASAEDWKTKFEALNNQIDKEKQEREQARLKAEKEANILKRFEAVDKDNDGNAHKWTHEAIKKSYLVKFGEAIESKDNEGKSDTDIFKALTKDDAKAFSGVESSVQLRGSNLNNHNNEPKTANRFF